MKAKYGNVPVQTIMSVFGCLAYVHVPDQTRETVFTMKAEKFYFVGFKSIYELDHVIEFFPVLNMWSHHHI